MNIIITVQNSLGYSPRSDQFEVLKIYSKHKIVPDFSVGTILAVAICVILLLFLILISLRK